MWKKPKAQKWRVRSYNEWTMTDAQFRSHIVAALRKASQWWKGKSKAIARARISRGMYKCENCSVVGPASLPPLPWKKRKRKNIQADHIVPVVWADGFTSYDDWIERCFVDSAWYQAICRECHSSITKAENAERRENKKKT